MKFSLLKNDKLPLLEQALADRRDELARAQAAHKVEVDRRNDLANQLAGAVLDDAENVGDLETKLNGSESKIRALNLATERGHQSVLAAEQSLTAEREKSERAAVAKKLRAHRDGLSAKKDKLVPVLIEFRDELWAAYYLNVVSRMGGADPQNLQMLAQSVELLVQQIGGVNLSAFIEHLSKYAEMVVDGTAPAELGKNIHDHHADLKQSELDNEALRQTIVGRMHNCGSSVGL